eukprot:CAMPEP_0117745440 /NCGR_PEP_ID=MMETSP0947-20121206/7358_1 /TAXON_ID=44440 /ORGANISM="Chattonella subsalsa, Strain CCMP2191" /LENGTH=581 /DNA_ID=CAMNT_0005562585 /DNA_START=79 /DNA_END=1821 /DNA_ORIENTATION=+
MGSLFQSERSYAKLLLSYLTLFIVFQHLALCEEASLSLLVQNEYSNYASPGNDYEWLEEKVLIEPHRETQLTLVNSDKKRTYRWKIYEDGAQEKLTFEGEEIFHIFTSLGFYTLEIQEYEGEFVTQKLYFELAVKYVRREIRKLSEQDRNELLDAMKLMWEIGDEEGRERWGGMYTSLFTLHKYHLIMSGDQACDHIHDGYGFLSHHSYLNFIFEQSLQSINPKLALPYWDFIYDVEEWNSVENELERWDFTNSEIFTEGFFGATDPETNFIADGRWANLQIPSFDSQYYKSDDKQVPQNAYGYLRAPWSNNPDPHLIRNQFVCGELPTNEVDLASRCGSLKVLFQLDNWESFGKYISYLPHGRVHVLLGGALNCKDAYDKLEASFPPDDKDTPQKIRSLSYAIHKNLYRNKYLDCSGVTTAGQKTCSCTNEDEIVQDQTRLDKFLRDAMPGFGLEAFTFNIKSTLVRTFCNSHLVDGDALQSSSSYAPEFWLIHSNTDRMFTFKLRYSSFKIGKWPDIPFFMDYEYEDYCIGHGAEDQVLLGMHPTDINGQLHIPSVREWLEMISPQRDDISYVYDELNW